MGVEEIGFNEKDKMLQSIEDLRSEIRELKSSLSDKIGALSSITGKKTDTLKSAVDEIFKNQNKSNKSIEELSQELIDNYFNKRQKDKDDIKAQIQAGLEIFGQKYFSSLGNAGRNATSAALGGVGNMFTSSHRSHNNYEERSTSSLAGGISKGAGSAFHAASKMVTPDKIKKPETDSGQTNPNRKEYEEVAKEVLNTRASQDREQLVKILTSIRKQQGSNAENSRVIDETIKRLSEKDSVEENKIKTKTVAELAKDKEKSYYKKRNDEKDEAIAKADAKIEIFKEKYFTSLLKTGRNVASDALGGIGDMFTKADKSTHNNYEESSVSKLSKGISRGVGDTANFASTLARPYYPDDKKQDTGQINKGFEEVNKAINEGNKTIRRSISRLDKYVRSDLIDDIMEEFAKYDKKKKAEEYTEGDNYGGRSTGASMVSDMPQEDSEEEGQGGSSLLDNFMDAKHLWDSFKGKGGRASRMWRRAKLGMRGSKIGRGWSAAKRGLSKVGSGAKSLLGMGSKAAGGASRASRMAATLSKLGGGAGRALGSVGRIAGKALPLLSLAQAGYGAYTTLSSNEARTKEASRLSQMGAGGRIADTLGLGNVKDNYKNGVMSGTWNTALDVLSAPVQWGKNIGTGAGLVSDIIGAKGTKKSLEKASDDRIANMSGDDYEKAVQNLKKPLPNGGQVTDEVARAAAVSQALRTMSIGPAMSVSQTNGYIKNIGDDITATLSSASSDLMVDTRSGKINVAKAKSAMEKLKSVSKSWERIRKSIKDGDEPDVHIDEKILAKGDDMYTKLLPARLRVLEEYIAKQGEKKPDAPVAAKPAPQSSKTEATKPATQPSKIEAAKPAATAKDPFRERSFEDALAGKPPEGYKEAPPPTHALRENISKIDNTTQPAIKQVGADIKEAVLEQNKNLSKQLETVAKQVSALADKKPVVIPRQVAHSPDYGFGEINSISKGT